MTFWKNYTWRQEKNLEAYRLRCHKQSFTDAYLSSKCKLKIISAPVNGSRPCASQYYTTELSKDEVPKEDAVLYIVAYREISV